jgi:glucan phosphoethanolaminetransferase (alkaline phosphatase superfamily)
MSTPRLAVQQEDARIDTRVVLSALWIATLIVFAYVDIFGFYRADVLEAALDGNVATTEFTVNQIFLTLTLIYILLPALMVVLSLLLRPPLNRTVNIVVSILYMISIIVSTIGERWTYYILGSAIEVILLAVIARSAWRWPPPDSIASP